jgi:hypothetical protein
MGGRMRSPRAFDRDVLLSGISVNLLSVGSFWFCSRVALEVALDEVTSVLVTRRLRIWDGIGGRFEGSN